MLKRKGLTMYKIIKYLICSFVVQEFIDARYIEVSITFLIYCWFEKFNQAVSLHAKT